MGIIYRLALFLVIIGAINWGLIGLFQFDLVAVLFGGADTFLSRTIYTLVGLSGLICIPLLFKAFEEDDVEIVDDTHSNAYTNLNYQTEFGEEEDFSEVQRNRVNEVYKQDGINREDDEDNDKTNLV